MSQKNIKSVLTLYFCVAVALIVSISPAFADIEISDETTFLGISTDLTGNYILTQSFTLAPTENSTYISGTFSGTLNGSGFTISGLTKPLFDQITGSYSDDLSNTSMVKDLKLITSEEGVTGRGILANDANSYTLIEKVSSEGSVNAGSTTGSVGGLVGSLSAGFDTSGQIAKSHSSAAVTGDDNIGGLVGVIGGSGEITESYATGTVSGDLNVGGLVGLNYGNISNSFATSATAGNSNVGGLVGGFFNSTLVINSYAGGSVDGHGNNIGGFVGYLDNGNIENSYASGSVKGAENIGGFVGWITGVNRLLIDNSFATGSVTGMTDGNVGRFYGNYYGEIGTFLNIFLGTGALTVGPDDTSETSFYGGPAASSMLSTINSAITEVTPGDKFGLDPCFNKRLPYLLSIIDTFQSSCDVVSTGRLYTPSFSGFLQTERVERINSPKGFVSVKPDLSNFNLELLPDNINNVFTEITGVKTSVNQINQVFLKVGEGLQVSLNSESKLPLQLWVRSPNGELVLFGVITFDENGKAVLPAIEFKNGGLFEFLFINSKENQIDQPDLINKVGGLTITVN